MRRLAVLLVASLCMAQQALTPAQRKENLDSFEYVWKAVRDHHWDPKLGGLDWQAVHDELRPKLDAASSTDSAREVMQDMLERLHQTHYAVFPGEVYSEMAPDADGGTEKGHTSGHGNPGLDLRVLDGHVIVTSVEPESPAAAYGVKPGWEILRIDDRELAPAVSRIQKELKDSTLNDLRVTRAMLGRLQGQTGTKVAVDFLDGKDRVVSTRLERVTPRGKIAGLGNFPGDYFWAEWRKVRPDARPDIGYVRFNMFMDPETLSTTMEQAVKACADCSGFIIDVRGNPGGIGGLAMAVSGWFMDREGVQLGTQYMRGGTIKYVVFPRPRPFRGPLAVLVDGGSASTSEIFAGGLKDVGRARIFGTRTAGAALPSIIERLPNGDGFQYAIANYISQGGKPLEGNGVIPDEVVHLTRHSLLEGHDAVLDAALDWIQKQKK